MNSKLLLHNKTSRDLVQLLKNNPNSILVTGVEGSGKETLAIQLASKLLRVPVKKLTSQAYFHHINPESDKISIEEVRSLKHFLKLKVPSSGNVISRVVLIERAERMRTEAQNAILKTLEEPPSDTSIILTVSSVELLLQTITSRAQQLNILPISLNQANEYFRGFGKKGSDIAKFYALSQGQAGLLYSLLYNQTHPLIDNVDLAKQILSESTQMRLLRTDELSKDKQNIKLLINALVRITHAALVRSAMQNKNNAVQDWRERQSIVLACSAKMGHNPNTKLLLDDLFLTI